MKKVAHLLRRFEFHALLFFLALFVFAKPTLIPATPARPAALFLAYFVPWALLIVVLYAIARSGSDDEDDDAPSGTSTPVARD
jgi:hypothetical protein